MIAENIKLHRINRGFSQEKLAEIAGVNLRTIQRLESGDTEPRGDTVMRIAEALGVNPGDLLDVKKREDRSFLKALSFSAYAVLLFPLLGVLLPFILWITKKDEIVGVDLLGKQIINFQITWNLILFSTGIVGYGLWYRYLLSTTTEVSLSTFWTLVIAFYSIFGALYLFNLILTTISIFRVWKERNVWLKPAIRFIR